jgi:hypothetical protein
MFIGILPTYYEVYAIGETEEEVKKNLVKGYKKTFLPALRTVKPTYEELHDYFGISIYQIDPKKGYTMEG